MVMDYYSITMVKIIMDPAPASDSGNIATIPSL